MKKKSTQSRGGVKGETSSLFLSPLQGQGAAPLVGFGATPQPLLIKTTQREQPTRRRQRSVPASNFALPQERPKLLSPSTQYCRARWARPRCLTSNRSGSLPQAEGFASAEATRGQWKQTKSAVAPLTPSGAPPCFLIFYWKFFSYCPAFFPGFYSFAQGDNHHVRIYRRSRVRKNDQFLSP